MADTKLNVIATIETTPETNTDPLVQQFNHDLSMLPLDETKLS